MVIAITNRDNDGDNIDEDGDAHDQDHSDGGRYDYDGGFRVTILNYNSEFQIAFFESH